MTLGLKRFTFQAFSSYCEIQIYDESRINAKKLTQQLAAEIVRIEKKYSVIKRNNFLLEINQSAGNKLGIKLDTETRNLFDIAKLSFEQSLGASDVTAVKLNSIWRDHLPKHPDKDELDQLGTVIGFEKLGWRGSRLYLPPEMQIDFGSILKEYATDAAAQLAKRLNVRHGLINLGGDFAVIGPQPDEKPWTIGVANPEEKNSLLATIEVLEGGVASSGDFSSCPTIDGKRYSTLVNAKTRWLCMGLRAATVASQLCTHAGSLARTSLSLSESDGLKKLEQESFKFAAMKENGEIQGKSAEIK